MLSGSLADSLRRDGNLFEPPPPRQRGKKGRPLPKPCDVLVLKKTRWAKRPLHPRLSASEFISGYSEFIIRVRSN
jgi:hypothetical protein